MNRKTRIRLRFSSIVNYSAMIYRMLVAIGFIVVARRLSVDEFGLWVLFGLPHLCLPR